MDLKAANAVLLVGSRFALQLRDDNAPTNPDTWGLFGGGIEAGESPYDALVRELQEELELDLTGAQHLADLNGVRVFVKDVTEQWKGHVLHEGRSSALFTLQEAMNLQLGETTIQALKMAKDQSMQMRWSAAWAKVETFGAPPERIRIVNSMLWTEFAAKVASSPQFADFLTGSLWRGDAWLLKGAFSPEFMAELRDKTVDWTRARPSSFHKMLEGSPDFHRVIDLETGRKYSIHGCKHSAYFYRWNDDPLGIWPTITERWRVAKTVMGLRPDEYETWTPKDGVVDRIQVVRYPPAIGYLEPHVDAWQHQRCFFSVYMSKRDVDYQGGGFYFVEHGGRARFIEDEIDVGDACLGHANLLHGVAPCDREKKPDWGATDGRWFLSLYSNASDEVAKRHTAAPVKVEVEGVLP